MKRTLTRFLCILSLLLLLTGCKVAAPDDEEFQDAWDRAWSDVEEDLEERTSDAAKNHYYQVLDSQGQELCTVRGEERLEALDDLLDSPGVEREAAPSDGEIACVYVFWQEKTLLAGQDPGMEREYEELVRFTVYQNHDLVTLEIVDGLEEIRLPGGVDLADLLTITMSVPAETMEALRDPARFAE